MANLLDQVNSIVLVMMENRSFDHILGALTLQDPRIDVNGLRPPLDKYNNTFNGTPFPVYERGADDELPHDVPHESADVATQLARNEVSESFGMTGFVEAYAKANRLVPNPQCEPMGYFPAKFLPMTNFLANNFCVCDNWFSPLPSSTQPNRTFAFSGDSSVSRTTAQLIDIKNDIFHWLTAHNNIRWRVYHEGFSFFTLYPPLLGLVLGDKFKRYEHLFPDLQNEPLESSPQVTVIEPIYEDAPHFGGRHADDSHAPLAVAWGEDFIRRTYQAITTNPEKWKGTLMILYYDEHGGFYDHEPPPEIPYTTTGGDRHNFTSMGPRIPAILVSPLVKPGEPCHLLLDHSSVLQLLAEKFGQPGETWSPSVEKRRLAGVHSVSEALNNDQPFPAPQEPNIAIPAAPIALGRNLTVPPQTEMGKAFELAGLKLLAEKPQEAAAVYPELVQWGAEAKKSDKSNQA